MRLNHTTLESSLDEHGHSHRLDITPKVRDKGSTITTYNARRFSYSGSNDPRDREMAVVKFNSCVRKNSKEWVCREQQIAKEAESHAKIFRNICENMGQCGEVWFLQPQSVSLEATSYIDKTRKPGEFLLFEDKLSRFQHFIDIEGKVVKVSRANTSKPPKQFRLFACISSNEKNMSTNCRELSVQIPAMTERVVDFNPIIMDASDRPPTYDESQAQYGYAPDTPNCNMSVDTSADHVLGFCGHTHSAPSCPPVYDSPPPRLNSSDASDGKVRHPVLQAYIHHAYCRTNGESVVSNLKGSREAEHGAYTLTTPTIHSFGQSHGDRDRGVAGILEVIGNHKCSKLCRHLPSMHGIFEDAWRRRGI